MQINEIFGRINDTKAMDAAIANTLNQLEGKTVSPDIVELTLRKMGNIVGVKSLKKLFDRFHDLISKKNISDKYNFYSSIKLPSNDPAFSRVIEVVEEENTEE